MKYYFEILSDRAYKSFRTLVISLGIHMWWIYWFSGRFNSKGRGGCIIITSTVLRNSRRLTHALGWGKRGLKNGKKLPSTIVFDGETYHGQRCESECRVCAPCVVCTADDPTTGLVFWKSCSKPFGKNGRPYIGIVPVDNRYRCRVFRTIARRQRVSDDRFK